VIIFCCILDESITTLKTRMNDQRQYFTGASHRPDPVPETKQTKPPQKLDDSFDFPKPLPVEPIGIDLKTVFVLNAAAK